MDAPTIPNHHHDHPGFAGLSGTVAAISMLFGRSGEAHDAVELLDLAADDRGLDLGCGPGTAVRHAAGIARSVIGVDPAEAMLRVARLTTRARNAEYRIGTAEALPLHDGEVTAVWSVASVHHWGDVDAGLAEVRRVLAPGGRFLAIESATTAGATGLASHGWTAEQVEVFAQRCRTAGFADVRTGACRRRGGEAHYVLAR